MKIKSSESKDNLGISGKGLITYLCIKAKVRPHKYNKARHAIVHISKRHLSKIIREFEKLPHESYERKRPKNEPPYSYFCQARQLVKCTMRADSLNLYGYPLRTEMTAMKQIPTSHICSTDESELKELPVDKTLYKIYSTDEDKSKGIIFKESNTKNEES